MVGDIRDEDAEETVRVVADNGGDAKWMHCDVGDEEQVQALTNSAIDAFGGIDVLVANAGISTRGLIHELSLADWERVIRVNLTGQFLCAREALKHMVAQENGVIVTIGSVSSVIIGAGGSAASYKAAKGGVLQLTRAIATEYAHKGIRANCVCPGGVATSIAKHAQEDAPNWTTEVTEEPRQYRADIPMKRFSDPAEIANVVAFLASDESSFMTGSAVMVDGGYTAV
jgi:NAD(P)-dependent dehydrogenase (short-subunit alcohol dehydrogenase family)